MIGEYWAVGQGRLFDWRIPRLPATAYIEYLTNVVANSREGQVSLAKGCWFPPRETWTKWRRSVWLQTIHNEPALFAAKYERCGESNLISEEKEKFPPLGQPSVNRADLSLRPSAREMRHATFKRPQTLLWRTGVRACRMARRRSHCEHEWHEYCVNSFV
jgi:hypothetical protein